MNEQWRQKKIIEKFAQMEISAARADEHKLSFRMLLMLAAYSLLLAIPLIFARQSADIFVGGTARTDVVSRVDFSWQTPKLSAIAPIYPKYREIPLSIWTENIISPFGRMLEMATHSSPEKLQHQNAPLKISADTAREICDYAASLNYSQVESEIVMPLHAVLGRWFFRSGIISSEQFAIENRRRDPEIEIISDDEHSRIVELNRDYSPLAAHQIEPLLRQMFYDTFPSLKPQTRTAMTMLLEQLLVENPTLLPVVEPLANIRSNALGKDETVTKDQLLVMRGQRISESDFVKIIAERRAWSAKQNPLVESSEIVALVILIFIVTLVYAYMFTQYAVGNHRRQLFGAGVVIFILVSLTCVAIRYGAAINFVPLGLLVGIVAISCGANPGMQTVVSFCLLLMLIGSRQFGAMTAFIAGGCLFAQRATKERFRMGLAKDVLICAAVSLIAGFIYTVATNAVEVMNVPRRFVDLFNANFIVTRAVWTLAGWVVSLLAILLSLRYARKLFGVTGNVVMQDYQEHELLTRLLASAPGTYFHSTMVAALAEAGVHAIGGNTLICKVGCLYHDIGKIMKPQYFSENEQSFSRHDMLSPYMSNLIVLGHVKDGIEMAKYHNLPREIIDVIAQHHGSTRTEFFLRRAKDEREAEIKAEGESEKNIIKPAPVDESVFQYPGPKPQTAEVAIIMLADSVEAASRSLANPSPEHLRKMVEKIAEGKLNQGQFNECPLTFAQLQKAIDAMLKLMMSMFHSRVSYDKVTKRLK